VEKEGSSGRLSVLGYGSQLRGLGGFGGTAVQFVEISNSGGGIGRRGQRGSPKVGKKHERKRSTKDAIKKPNVWE